MASALELLHDKISLVYDASREYSAAIIPFLESDEVKKFATNFPKGLCLYQPAFDPRGVYMLPSGDSVARLYTKPIWIESNQVHTLEDFAIQKRKDILYVQNKGKLEDWFPKMNQKSIVKEIERQLNID